MVSRLNLKQKKRFYKNRDRTRKIIIDNVKKKDHIVHGATATNRLFPDFLDKQTEDVDVFSETPRETANRVEARLDKSFGGDFFRVEPGIHEGTFKVMSNVTDRTAADYTKPDSEVPTVRRGGIRFATFVHAKSKIKESLGNPDAMFRHRKDRELRQRIKIAEELPERKRAKKDALEQFQIPKFRRRF